MSDIYMRLAKHLEDLIMGYPYDEALIDLLKEMFSPVEAEVALAIPNNLAPLEVVNPQVVVERSDLPEPAVIEALQSLAGRNMLYTRQTEQGAVGYALLQVGYGIPQAFFWGGQKDDGARRMAKLLLKYFSVPTTAAVYSRASTKTYKYSPANVSLNIEMQGVMPNEQMGSIVDAATKVAVAHCPCRMQAKILGRTDCHHSLEVCIKYDELAEFVIGKGLAREISKDEAMKILADSEKQGLVHMVDNSQGQIKHTCNCCGHYCWNVGILRRRKIPRDMLMAVYFIRKTDLDECIGCGSCADICPVDAVTMADERPKVDQNWCIGCGVCAVSCPAEVISLVRRLEISAPKTFSDLHQKIKQERDLAENGIIYPHKEKNE